MASIITQNSALTGTGVIYEGKVDNLGSVDLWVEDNGGGSTITFESSTDDATWGTITAGVYNVTTGVLVANAGTTTAKGRYLVDVKGMTYIRIRVSTYVSGTVVTRFGESVTSVKGQIASMLVTGLIAQGTTQATALPIQGSFNVFATVAASSGAVLPPINRNGEIRIKNGGANTLTVYPPVGNSINGGSANAGVTIAAAGISVFVCDGVGNYWTF